MDWQYHERMKTTNPIIARRIKEIRTEAGLTQKQFADLFGITASGVSRWEQGETSNTKRETLNLMSEKFGVNPMWILGFDELKEKRTVAEDDLVGQIEKKLAKMDETKLRKVIRFMDEFL